jgi:alkanesulfonate monooxygenase SsuD/methylene tetrahydromethanopterin reductase-like flavin-dependent oxidoreductase (luciferase family)
MMQFWLMGALIAPEEMVEIAAAAEELGFYGVSLSDHLFVPQELSVPYPYSEDGAPPFSGETAFPDPWVTIAGMAARTSHLRFSTNVYLGPLRHPLIVAKAIATADRIAGGGRISLGLAPGWMPEEYSTVGLAFDDRGSRLNEWIDAFRALGKPGWVEHHGAFYDFGPLQIAPIANAAIPILGGGHTKPALRDGWIGANYSVAEAVAVTAEVRDALDRADRDPAGFEMRMGLLALPDADTVETLTEAGVTGIFAAPWRPDRAMSTEQRIDALNRYAQRFIVPLAAPEPT